MDSESQQAYLRAMGIPLYVRRGTGGPQTDGGLAAEAEAVGTQEGAERSAALEALRADVAECTACPLHAGRTQTVFGVGDPDAALMLVGEAPGSEEDRRGEPFVGRAGKLLDAMLAAIGLDRNGGGVFIANVLKCRPPRNRDPEPEEVAQCQGYLRRQIELVAPELIVAMGRVAAQDLVGSKEALGRLRQREHRFHETPLLVTYHPAYLLRNPADKAKAWADLKAIRKRLAAPDANPLSERASPPGGPGPR